MKTIIIFVLLVPAIAFGGDCEKQGGTCIPFAPGLICPSGAEGVPGLGCAAEEVCCKPGEKCCVVIPFQECFSVAPLTKATACKGHLIDCPCSPNCTLRCVENEKCCTHGARMAEIPYGITEADCLKNGWTVNPISCERVEQQLTRKCCLTDNTCMNIPQRIAEEECLSEGWVVIYCRFSNNCF